MKNNYMDFQKKFRIDELTIFETEYWKWSLRPVQVTVGAGILSLKRPEEKLSNLTDSESEDLIKIVRVIERTLSKLFGYKHINYLMLMMVDFHIHYHVIPRYSESVVWGGITWIDESYPKPPAIGGTATDDDILYLLLEHIKKNI